MLIDKLNSLFNDSCRFLNLGFCDVNPLIKKSRYTLFNGLSNHVAFFLKNNTARVVVFFSLSQKSLSQFNCLIELSLKNGKRKLGL